MSHRLDPLLRPQSIAIVGATQRTDTVGNIVLKNLLEGQYPGNLIAALQKARRRKIPVVVVKVGRTSLSSLLAESHSGAMAGSDVVYDAIFDYYGNRAPGQHCPGVTEKQNNHGWPL